MAPPSLRLVRAASTLLLAASTAAQTYAVIDYNKLPACAKSCSVLSSAEKACIPPTQPVTSQNAYQACFCSASPLAGLYSSPTAVCSNVCTSASDQGALKDYYVKLCTGGVVVTPGAASQPSTASSSASTSTSTAFSSTHETTSSSQGGGGTWFSNHWKWVVMLIVIFLAMVIGSILGVWLKRRHHRKRDARGANLAARDAPLFTNTHRGRSAHPPPPPPLHAPNGAAKEMAMSGGINAAMSPQPSRPATRSQPSFVTNANHHSNSHGYYPQPNGDGYAVNQDFDGANFTPPPQAAYAGRGDLPERTYSPVISSANSMHVSSRPSSIMQQLDTPTHGRAGSMRGYRPSSPVSPIQEPEGPITGAQRIREMRSRDHMSARSSPLSYSEEPEPESKRSSRRLSKKNMKGNAS